jgi:prepilin-type N-terminal cleavage/methylation domain-containing protein
MSHPNFPRHQSGFTLIEIAIVLVIIGLLLGGILKGQELITQGRIRNVSNDMQSMTAAINLYQGRYLALPGDDAGAAARWDITGPTSTGDVGDGVIDGAYNTSAAADESRQFWLHLRRAGLVGGAVNDSNPPNAVGGVTGVQNGAFGLSGIVVCTDNLPAVIAQAIDTQFDDSNATSGSVRAATAMDTSAPSDNYIDDGSNFYIVCMRP